MADIAGFPYYRVEFDKSAKLIDAAQATAVLDAVAPGAGFTDLFVVSHGWNNDMNDAQDLYRRLFEAFRGVLTDGAVPGVAGRAFAVLGVFWPSKKFADEEVIPGGAASVGAAAGGAKPVLPGAALERQLDRLKGVFDHANADQLIEQAKVLVARLEDSPEAQRQFADLLRQLPGRSAGTKEDASDEFFTRSGDDLLKRLSAPPTPAVPGVPLRLGGAGGGAAGGPGRGGAPGTMPGRPGSVGQAAGIGDWFSGVKAGALNMLNFTTYYQMKERAGTIGAGPVNELLGRVRTRNPALRIHLIGHSFGGRLVTAAAAGPQTFGPSSMTLLQAAFSHNGFSSDYDGRGAAGFFRVVVQEGRVSGPILISHSDKDRAVGVAYPLASRINGEQAAALGDANDRYGGIGRNGAVHTTEAAPGTLLKVRAPGYSFARGRLYNLNADATIGGHSDICKAEVAYAVLTAVAGT
jgi:hypothetical protein